jgi:5-methyltetrahydropteroyltriglutamate--homocysteine methyltransferase
MQRSTTRFLTTHTGSLPRPDDLVRMMFAKEDGVALDRDALAARIASGVADVVQRQVAAGIDIVDDGEYSKPNYASYIKDRLTGFEGSEDPIRPRDLQEFPEVNKRRMSDPGRSRRHFPACNGPIAVRDTTAAAADIANLKAAMGAVAVEGAFLTAASPGVVSHFFHNHFYPDHEAYLFAIADAMRGEYEAVAKAGLTLQIDCPDLAMGRSSQFAEASLEKFREMARLHVAALNHATANIAPEQLRMHLCWGNYDGPHHHDVEIADIIDIVFEARPAAISFEAANPRHAHEYEVFETVKLPPGKILIPGVIETKNNYIEHPNLVAQRIGRYASLVGPENVIAGSDCGFGTSVGSAQVDPAIAWAKLATLAEGARRASRKFWKGAASGL